MRPLALYWSLMLWVMPPLAAVEPVILNVQAEQIPGTRWFDISYEIRDPDSAVVSVSLKISAIEGWEFLGWSGDYVSNDPKLSWEVKAPTHRSPLLGRPSIPWRRAGVRSPWSRQ